MGSADAPARFVAWDTVADKLHKIVEIPAAVTVPTSFLQDFALDEKRGKRYIADMTFPPPGTAARPAFIIVDIATGEARRLLESDPILMPVSHDIVIDGSLVGAKLEDGKSVPLHLGLNPIAIDPDFEFVYFGTVNGDDTFRLPTAAVVIKPITS